MKRWKAVAAAFVGTLIVVAAIAVWLAVDSYRKTQQTPEFYQAAIAIPPQRIEELHAEVQQSLERLEMVAPSAEEVATDSAEVPVSEPQPTWEWTVTDAQANAWLAKEAPEYLAKGKAPLSDPRVEFEDGVAKVAVRYQDSNFSSVLSGELRVQLDPETGEIDAQLTGVRSGMLSLPLDWAKERIEHAIARVKWPIRAETIADSIRAESELPDEGFKVRDGRRLQPTEIVVEADRLIVRGIVLADDETATAVRPVSTRVAQGS